MRVAAPVSQPVVLTIAGSDSGGGAGIQADLKTIEAHRCFGTSAITALTAQNTVGVEGIDVVTPTFVAEQIEAVVDDMGVDAIKTGMLATASIIETVTAQLEPLDVPIVIDPVMVAASGDRLLDSDGEAAYDALIESSTIVTPNADEAEVLTGIAIEDHRDAIKAGSALVESGAQAALIKGGHWGGELIEDVLVTRDDALSFSHPRIDTDATHGSGCTLASAIAARLARGASLEEAVGQSVDYLGRAVRYHHAVGQGPGAVNHLIDVEHDAAARETIDRVRTMVRSLIEGDISNIVPEVGMNVVGTTPTGESPDDVAAVDGRLTRRLDGVARCGEIRFGGSGHVARLLMAVREHDPTVRFGVNCRFGDDVELAMERLGWETIEIDRESQPESVRVTEGSTMDWIAREAFGSTATRPTAVFDRGAPGKEAMTRILTTTAGELRQRVLDLSDELA